MGGRTPVDLDYACAGIEACSYMPVNEWGFAIFERVRVPRL